MAGLKIVGTTGEVTYSTTPETGLQIKAPTNQRVVIKSIRALGKQAAGGTDTPVKIRGTRSTSNFGTAGSSVTPGKLNPSNGETIQSTWGAAFSVEPTSPTDSGMWWEVQPQTGIIEFLPPGQEIEIPGGQAFNFEVTAGAGTPKLTLTVTAEE